MPLKVIQKADLQDFVRLLMADYEVVGVRKDKGVAFGRIDDPEELFLEYKTTILPPKKYFLPPTETLFEFKLDGSPVVSEPGDSVRRVVFGVHPCDIHALWLLDAAMTQGQFDGNYASRRANSLVVGLNCAAPCDEHSFCKSMGTNTATEGYDLMLTDIGDAYVVETGTPDGEALLAGFGAASDITYNDRAKLRSVQQEMEEAFPEPLEVDIQDLPDILEESANSLLWDVLGDKCLSCGQCTIVCPTCYCFDVADTIDLSLESGERYRRWDGCVLKGFAEVAGGENFRKKTSHRQRHRFFRKGKYLIERFGEPGCVGCGRCSRSCLVHIDPIEVYNQLGVR